MDNTPIINDKELLNDIQEYRQHFDAIYVSGIPKLFNEDSAFLAFVSILTAIEALSGLFAPSKDTGVRFKLFVAAYFPIAYKPYTEKLWQFRNSMIHSFNPGPFALTCHTPRNHLKTMPTNIGDVPMLNIEDFYSTLLIASGNYFESLLVEIDLQENFTKRVAHKEGGASQTWEITEHKH